MKAFSLVTSIILTTLILILAFGNVAAQCTYINFLFWPIPANTSPTMLIFFATFIGIIAGVFYTIFFKSVFAEKSEEEEDF